MVEEARRGRGRPRDAGIDARVMAATLELLAEEGFAGANVQAISRRANVHSSAIYRRWPTRIELIEEAVFPGLDVAAVRPSGDLGRDLRRFLRNYVRTRGSPAARAAASGLLASYQGGVTPRNSEDWIRVSARPQFQDILNAAPAGSIDPDLNPDDVFDMLVGAVLGHVLVPTLAGRPRFVERTVDLVIRLLRPLSELDRTRPSRPTSGEPTR
jgi:AcrR family transcriptional regulator